MFIDASAIVAVLLREAGHEAIEDALYGATEPLRFSPCVRLEAALALAKAKSGSGLRTSEGVRRSAESIDIVLRSVSAVEVDVTPAMGAAAIEAAARFGRGIGHKAKLNYGDCLTYGCAKTMGERLLFVGADFVHTDVERAI